ncbi:MAG: MmcQ/YjbR family DNA-binding protein [Candidatus Margulisbacteria bacterium]|jgi:predicted DNA-binding protein (MmcQ/YjbR family)|nr:MmcQ/YjbR family DNA-binding protein [Candidatus Margulisiibacteriota bacterium]
MMLKQLLDYARAKDGVEYEYKESWQADVVKVKGKMFAFAGQDKAGNNIINLKNDPAVNLELRAAFPDFVTAGYYSNKEHWNSWYYAKKGLKMGLLKEQIDRSYELVAD